MPPSYGSQAYWDDRFKTEDVYEWLMPADSFNAVVRAALHGSPAPQPSILHIGCGSSNVPFQLRRLVASAKQVTNVDYSEVAVTKCVQRELQFLGTTGGPRALERMRWATTDLLSADSLAALMGAGPAGEDGAPRRFDVVVDKSTSDSIACSADTDVLLPFASPAQPGTGAPRPPRRAFKVHPLHLLAVHLAAVTRPGTGRWCVLSYSNDRYPFLRSAAATDEDADIDPQLLDNGFPDPRKLWKLECRQEIVPRGQPEAPTNGEFIVHRPATTHWLYVLARTETEL